MFIRALIHYSTHGQNQKIIKYTHIVEEFFYIIILYIIPIPILIIYWFFLQQFQKNKDACKKVYTLDKSYYEISDIVIEWIPNNCFFIGREPYIFWIPWFIVALIIYKI